MKLPPHRPARHAQGASAGPQSEAWGGGRPCKAGASPSRALSRSPGGGVGRATLPACVAAVKHGWVPSYLPSATPRGRILWLSFRLKTGTSMAAAKSSSSSEAGLGLSGRPAKRGKDPLLWKPQQAASRACEEEAEGKQPLSRGR